MRFRFQAGRFNFTRTDILRGLAEFIDDPLELRVASDRALMSPDLLRLDDGTEQFTTYDFQAVERQLATIASDMARLGNFRVNSRHVERAIAKENAKLQRTASASLSQEQVQAIHRITSPTQLSNVVGLAGAGKSTLLNAAREAWERQGYRVHGAALAGKAADSLQSASGIPSRTLASLETSWRSGYEPVSAGSILVIDEAGMLGTRQLVRVAEQLRQRGCKLVLVGDPEQLQPIEAGTPFRDIINNHGAAWLTEIHRQKDDWQRQASRDLASGQIDRAIQTYTDQGHVHEEQSRDHAISAMVEDYMTHWKDEPNRSRLALAHRRKDVHAINQAIKTARRMRSDAIEEYLFDTDHGPRTFAIGDRILFTRNDATLNVRNGMLGTLVNVGNQKLTVEIDVADDGTTRTLTFSPQDFAAIDHGFAVSIHRSQGCTVDRSFVLSSRTMDKHLTYVALTRHKEETGFYTAPEIARKPDHNKLEHYAPEDFRRQQPSRSR